MNRETLAEELRTDLPERLVQNFSQDTSANLIETSLTRNTNPRKIARRIYNIRQKREQFFSSGLFSDPAWDIILDLYMAEEDKKEICITSACIAAGVPTSTGLRWITILIQNGYVERHDDPADARRSLLRLTDAARDALEALLGQLGDD
ncbi:hypothetical protein [Novosphingobium naphthalenivorans]|uniref:hypothetical protein n=1 Tax=Novosphingobium naphthalenivorans TaxID=273168 RepID=UPI000AAA0556|nr:hypothetical protein [Novosphingobium naphthalenivorans]